MTAQTIFLFSLSIVLVVVIGIVRYKKIDPLWYPFLYYAVAVLLMEILVNILTEAGPGPRKNLVYFLHFYSFIEFFLFTWLFHNWGLFNHRRKVFINLLAVFFVIWLVTTFIIAGFRQVNHYFLILYSFVLIFFSVSTFTKVIIHERGNIFTNPKFLICIGIIIFYTIFILVTASNLSVIKFNVSMDFRKSLQEINVYSNFLVNLVYALAVLWIPRKKNFTTLF